MDSLSPERRSWNMSRIRGKDTRPELVVRSLLHGLGYRFRLNRKDLPGKPDIVLPKYRTAIFVHGCFWHRHTGCKKCYTPKSSVDFWQRKFAGNAERDRNNAKQLRREGWRVIVVWECELGSLQKLQVRLDRLLRATSR
jgi:DNA mismatch endonuclease (patch repair protein)